MEKKSTTTKAEKRFNDVVGRYVSAFSQKNGYEPHEVFLKEGWVYLTLKEESSTYKYRISEFEKMTTTLESRIAHLTACIEKASGNGWQTDGRDADEQVRELRGNDH